MKKYVIPVYLFIALLALSCSSPTVTLTSDFDRGSLGAMQQVEPGSFRGQTRHWLKKDGIGDQYYWFYFRADHVQGQSITFELDQLTGVYRGTPHIVYTEYTQPVYSYDQINWKRIADTSYDSSSHTFTFRQQFDQEPVWIAYAHPFPVSRIAEMIQRIQTSQYLEISEIAKTTERRGVPMFSITDFRVAEGNKKNILILAMQHAGEDAGGFMAEGIINFLLSDHEEAIMARRNFNYFIVPIMNPDGLYHGISRYNANMEDLNNIWMTEEESQPEVDGVKAWFKNRTGADKELDLFIDIHNHTQFHRYNVFIFQDHKLDSLVPLVDRHWPARIWHSEFKGSSCSYFFNKGIPSMTIELTQSSIGDGDYLQIRDYLSYGTGLVLALNAFYDVDSGSE